MLLVGENGIGKKSFINTLCRQQFFSPGFDDDMNGVGEDKFQIENYLVDIVEPGSIPIKLKVSMTKNFGFNIDNNGNSQEVLKYIESIYDDVLEQEQRIKRNPRFEDNRIHVALYFIRTGCNQLQELDIECMKAISARINLLPVISKIDAINENELRTKKSMIENDLRNHDIKIWDFLQNIDHRDVDEVEYLKFLQTKVPFGIINSNLTILNHQFRMNKIGKIDVEDEKICDNKVLKTVLFGSHLQEFKENTVATKYEAFRVEQLENRNQ